MIYHEKRDFKVEILDKWHRKFLWWDRYYFSVKFLDAMRPKYKDIPTSRATWVGFKVGSVVVMPMYKASDGLWYPA